MEKLRRACAIAILTMALAVFASAGTIDSPGAVSQPPPPPSGIPSTSTSITTTVILTILSLIR